ncbi:MAG TPA: DUF4189 domain-containing protein [Candidatus Acidoferrum sp.]|nr:DUF4189 domain-containing protein [Candidatus Acidoferrum sp.]
MDGKQLIGIAIVLSCLTATAAAEDGALAYSPSTDEVSSGSSGFFTLRELQMKTLENCKADDCRIVATMRAGQCAAVASSDKSFGVGKGASQAEADAAAMENCSNGGADKNCRVVGQQCAKE